MFNFWAVRLTTFMLWALAAGSAAFWILQSADAAPPDSADQAKMVGSPAFSAGQASLTADSTRTTSQVALALGAKNPVTPTAASALAATQARLQLMGVLAVGGKNGAALISVDGKPAKPYRVGAAIEEGLEVTSIAARSASIGANGSTAFTLDLPLRDNANAAFNASLSLQK